MMSYTSPLIVILVVQVILLVGTLALLAGRRVTAAHEQRRLARADELLREPLGRVLVDDTGHTELVNALATLPPELALDELIQIASHLPPESRAALARAARHAPWVERLIARHGSRAWWRRLQAARLLAIVADAADRDAVRALLADPHPAVRAASTDSLLRMADTALVRSIIASLATESAALRKYRIDVLRQLPGCVVPIVREHLTTPGPEERLLTALALAEALHDPTCLKGVLAHVHADSATIRVAATRAVRGQIGEDVVAALQELLGDSDWRVRAQAARGLGEAGAVRAIPALVEAVSDSSWWVRLRSALALAALGEPGIAAVRAAARMNDAFGREMAAFVGNLQHAALAELSE